MTLLARNIVKTFRFPKKVAVLSGISLSADEGDSIAICGRSGEGKTTLLHILGTLEQPDSGIVEIGGQRITPSNAPLLRNRTIGFVFQSFHLLEDFSALENVLMPARIARRSVCRAEGMALLDLVGLADRAHFPVNLLSGGERQRVAIARALCNDPLLILADEPSGNLDAETGMAIGSLLFSLVRERKKTLLLATHDETLAALCNRRYLLSNGLLAEE